MENELVNENRRYIKFALLLKDGAEVRTMSELKEHFDVYEILESFTSRKLNKWLRHRYHEDKAEKMEYLLKQYKDNAIKDIYAIVEKICEILEVEYTPAIKKDIEQYATMENIENLVKKAQNINSQIKDTVARINFRKVARNQEEIEKLLETETKIYLLPFKTKDKLLRYEIPANTKPVCYIGVEDMEDSLPIVMFTDNNNILSKEEVSNNQNIILSNLTLCFKLIDEENDSEDEITFNGRKVKVGNNKIDEKKDKDINKKLNELLGINTRENFKTKSNDNSRESVKKQIIRCMDANFPLIYLKTFEESKADEIVCSVLEGRKFYEWNAEGFFERDKNGNRTGYWGEGWKLNYTLSRFIKNDLYHTDKIPLMNESNLSDEARFTKESLLPDLKKSVLVLKDAHKFLEDYEIIAKLKYLCQIIYRGELNDCNIVIVSPVLVLPKEIENYITIVTLDYLRADEIWKRIKKICDDNGVNLENLSNDFKKKLVEALKGLSAFDITNIISLAISSDKELNAADWERIIEHKKRMVEKTNILEMIDVEIDKDDIGGLENLKNWLDSKSKIYKNWAKAKEYNVDIPKGVMIAGMPGCGKSITAKVTADMFEIPLLRMDIGKIMGKYVGESEQRMRQALRLSESVAPCVLWIDEIEKAFSGINGDGGGAEVTTRLFGMFLTWMQENTERVFIVATANDVTKLPPELLRKGRFDEIFYVDFPKPLEREQIFKIHLKKRGKTDEWEKEINEEQKKELIYLTKGYSGADIEGLIKETIERDFIENVLDKKGRNFFDILMEVQRNITPLKISMGATLNKLTQTYKKGRYRSASNEIKYIKGNIINNNMDNNTRRFLRKCSHLPKIIKIKFGCLREKINKRVSSEGEANESNQPQ